VNDLIARFISRFEKDLTFLDSISVDSLTQIFDHLPSLYFVIKDKLGFVVAANKFATQSCGFENVRDFIGKCDHDIFEIEKADMYTADDKQVMSSGEAMINKV
jgi:hypothetical protein